MRMNFAARRREHHVRARALALAFGNRVCSSSCRPWTSRWCRRAGSPGPARTSARTSSAARPARPPERQARPRPARRLRGRTSCSTAGRPDRAHPERRARPNAARPPPAPPPRPPGESNCSSVTVAGCGSSIWNHMPAVCGAVGVPAAQSRRALARLPARRWPRTSAGSNPRAVGSVDSSSAPSTAILALGDLPRARARRRPASPCPPVLPKLLRTYDAMPATHSSLFAAHRHHDVRVGLAVDRAREAVEQHA